jgi:hypothetical protein
MPDRLFGPHRLDVSGPVFCLSLRDTVFRDLWRKLSNSPEERRSGALVFIGMQVQMKLHTTAAFDQLRGILRSGAVLSRVNSM